MAPVPRVRHWSCPEPLPSASLPADYYVAPAHWELEDLPPVGCTPRPSRWEERVLELREGRGERRQRRLALVARLTAASPFFLASKRDNDADIEEIIEGKLSIFLNL
jgi:hypothetical protein